MQRHEQAAAAAVRQWHVARAGAARAAVTPATRALCFSYTGPGLVRILSDWLRRMPFRVFKLNWLLSSQPGSSPVGDSESAHEQQSGSKNELIKTSL
jgi:hypothetical protein